MNYSIVHLLGLLNHRAARNKQFIWLSTFVILFKEAEVAQRV